MNIMKLYCIIHSIAHESIYGFILLSCLFNDITRKLTLSICYNTINYTV